jgi:hypothetical protein
MTDVRRGQRSTTRIRASAVGAGFAGVDPLRHLGEPNRSKSGDGADGTRTRALLAASQSLSQLSYGPGLAQCSCELELSRPPDSPLLVVSRRPEPKLKIPLTGQQPNRHEVARVEFMTVRRDRVDLSRRVRAPQLAVRGTPRRVAANDDDIAMPGRRLALNAHECRPEIKDEVVPLAICQRLEHTDVQLARGMGDCQLGNRTFFIRREHPPSIAAVPDDACCRNRLRRS